MNFEEIADPTIIRLPDLPLEERILIWGRDETGDEYYDSATNTVIVANGCNICLRMALDSAHENHKTMHYIGWGGKRVSAPTTWSLGFAMGPIKNQNIFSRTIFDIAYGWVNGFPPSAILYFVLTRSIWPISIRNKYVRWKHNRR